MALNRKLRNSFIAHSNCWTASEVVKLTEKKVKYIIRAKTKKVSTKNIARDMKLNKSTVKLVWMDWIKHEEPIVIKKFGRKKKETDEKSEKIKKQKTLSHVPLPKFSYFAYNFQ